MEHRVVEHVHLDPTIGVKLFFHALPENEQPFISGGHHVEWAPEIGTFASLGVIVGAMTVAVVASVIKLKVDARAASGSPDSVDSPE